MRRSRTQLVDGMRPMRRRTPNLHPHRKTLIRISKKSRKISRSALYKVLISFAALLIGASYIVLFWTSLFQIDEPVIIGAERVPVANLEKTVDDLLAGRRWGVLPRNALLAISSYEIEQALLDAVPAISSVEVRKEVPNILKINVTEREPLAIWSAAGEFFFVDERGVAYDEIARSDSRDTSLPVIVDERNRATVEGDRVVTEETLDFVKISFDDIKRVTGVGINFFIAPSRLAPDLILVTSEGWKVIFDTNSDATTQASTLAKILDEQTPDRSTLEYIDMRISGRVFVK